MTRGRPAKPDALKRLAGNPGHRPLNDAAPVLESGVPKCPTHLKGESRREWKRVVIELQQAGLLTSVDRAALAAYCVTWARWVEAEKHLEEESYTFQTETGYKSQNPWVGIANSALTLMHKFMIEFGMTPSSRSRVKVNKPEAADPFETFLSQRGGVEL